MLGFGVALPLSENALYRVPFYSDTNKAYSTAARSYYLRQGGYVFSGVSLLVCLQAGFRKNYTQPIFTKFAGRVAQRPC